MTNRTRKILEIALKTSQTQSRFESLPMQNDIIDESRGNSAVAVPNLQTVPPGEPHIEIDGQTDVNQGGLQYHIPPEIVFPNPMENDQILNNAMVGMEPLATAHDDPIKLNKISCNPEPLLQQNITTCADFDSDESMADKTYHSLTQTEVNQSGLQYMSHENYFPNSMENDQILNNATDAIELSVTAHGDHAIVNETNNNKELSRNNTPTFVDFDSDDSVADETYQPLESEEPSEESHSENEADGTEQTAAPKSSGKKRKSNPKKWQKNVHKRKVTGGLERKTKCGTVNAKQVGLPCKDSCHLRCSHRNNNKH